MLMPSPAQIPYTRNSEYGSVSLVWVIINGDTTHDTVWPLSSKVSKVQCPYAYLHHWGASTRHARMGRVGRVTHASGVFSGQLHLSSFRRFSHLLLDGHRAHMYEGR